MTAPDSKVLASLAYRMEAIAIGRLALRHHVSWEEVPSMEIFFDGRQVVDGKATGFTNAAIEAAVIHCRAILEFLGLQGTNSSSPGISNRPNRRNGDLGVEQFSALSMLTREQAVAAYSGPETEAEAALCLIFQSANKGLAHMTSAFTPHSAEARHLEIAFRRVPVLLIIGFYAPLGIQPPNSELTFRSNPN
jgi:hypothetical protein